MIAGDTIMRRVVIESPYGAADAQGIAENVAYARRCVVDCLKRGESGIASHLLYTQPGILDDAVVAERALGINAGLAWHQVADAIVFYMDRGMSNGMQAAENYAKFCGAVIERRWLGSP